MTEDGRTVFLSSHLLNEVERLADRVAIVERGKVLVESTVGTLKEELCRLTARFEQPPLRSGIPGLVSCRQLGERWQLTAWARSTEERRALERVLEDQGASELRIDDSSLESIFVDLVGGRGDG